MKAGRRKLLTSKYRLSSVLFAFLFLLPLYAKAMTVVNLYSDTIVNEDNYNSPDFRLVIYDEAKVDMVGGRVEMVTANSSSIFNLYDGTVGVINALGSSTINLYGGTLDSGFQSWESTSTINIYGSNFSTTIENGYIYLSGTWADGTDFSFYFYRSLEIPENVILHVVPEPCTLVLMSFGLFIMRRTAKNIS